MSTGMSEITIILIFLGIIFFLSIFFLLTVQTALERCSPESRTMNPGNVWLLLIPLSNFILQFMVVSAIASSLENEFKRRNIVKEANPGKQLGLACCILGCCSIIPIIGIATAIIALVCWIIYWVKISGYSSEIAMPYIPSAAEPLPPAVQ